jgi:ferredoxin
MATIITNECINCGACEPECPNTAIYAGGVEWELNGVKHPAIASDIFYIVRDKCTECVGFFDHEACAEACPVDCCIPDSNDPEGEDVLIARARQLHPDRTFAGDVPSRFRKAGAPAPAPPEQAAVPASPEPAPEPKAPATESKPVVPEPPAAPAAPVPPAPPASAPTPAAPVVAAPAATAAPAAPASQPAPAAAPAAPTPAAPKPAPESKPPAPKPGAQPTPVASKPAAQPEAAPAPAATPQPAAPAAPSPPVAAPSVEAGPSVPDLEELEIPIECFRCGRTSAVPFKHFRTGTVLYCPSCHGSYVVNTSMHNGVSRALRDFHQRLCQQLARFQAQRKQEMEEFEQRQHAQLEAFNEFLKKVGREFRPPGAPRRRAGMFGQARS